MTVPASSGGNSVQGVFIGVTMSHTWVGDLTMKVRSPAGTVLTFLNRPGSNAADDGGGAVGNNANWSNVQLLFGDGFGPEAETMGDGLTTDQRVCLDNGVCNYDPSPDTAVSPASFAAAFNGQAVAGNWTLCVGDSALGDVGTVSNWRLNFINSLAPTAAPVSVSGRVMTPLGSSIQRARVTLMSAGGQTRQTMTNSFGNFSFDGVNVGETYLISVQAKGYSFETQTIRVEDEIKGVEFIGQPSLFFKSE
jgi:subtilisin-like proprotein convertase family protein